MVTRPLIDSIASITRPSWRNGVGSMHWLKQAKRPIISGMGGCSLCRVGLGNPYSTRYSTALPHFHTVLSRSVSSPILAKVLFLIQHSLHIRKQPSSPLGFLHRPHRRLLPFRRLLRGCGDRLFCL